MPRRARDLLPNVPLHIIQRGNNRQACFYRDYDYRLFLNWLSEAAIEFDCMVHAYVLMTNHFHLLITPLSVDGPAQLMKQLGQRYVQYVNRTHHRSGTLWEGRFKSCIAQSELYTLACYRYIELNPVRAAMVTHPGDYQWSSYRQNALGDEMRIVQPHSSYLALGQDSRSRLLAYQKLFKQELSCRQIDEIRSATNGNFVLGDPAFQIRVSAILGHRVTPGKAGRPKKAKS